MKTIRLRSAVSYGLDDAKTQIDYRAGIIRGVSLMQAVDALGHGMTCDQITLQQVADQANACPDGIKSRFSHPGACEDSTGKMLGRVRNVSVSGDKVIGDLCLSQSSKKSPNGDLYSYVLARAQEDPKSFGLSVVVNGAPVWCLQDGTEVSALDADGCPVKAPAGVTAKLPSLRIKTLSAVDVVDEPAANRSGMFSATTAALSEEAFASIDEYAAANGLSLERMRGFAERYFAARGHTLSASSPAVKPATQTPLKGTAMTPEEIKSLKAQHPAHAGLILDSFGDGKSVAETLAAIDRANIAQLAKKTEDLLAAAAKERSDHAASLQAARDQVEALKVELAAAKKVADLGAGAPKDVGGLGLDGNDPSSEASLESLWATDKQLRAKFFGDKEAFLALGKIRGTAIHTEEGMPRAFSLTPVSFAGTEPINHKAIHDAAKKLEG